MNKTSTTKKSPVKAKKTVVKKSKKSPVKRVKKVSANKTIKTTEKQ
jgi:hypothetical protein